MNTINRIVLILISFCLLIVSCKFSNNEIKDIKEYYSVLDDEANGLVKSKRINGLILKIKYLPKDYFLYKYMSSQITDTNSLHYLDSTYSLHSFLFTISIDDDRKDIVFSGIKSYSEYAQRIQELHFYIEQALFLHIGNEVFAPISTSFENTYGLKNSRDVLILFKTNNRKKADPNDFKIEFKDSWFGTGTNYFRFSSNDLMKFPKLRMN